MPSPAPLTFLLANERAEEIKLATLSMRGFYPGCHVEAVYSVEEALDYAVKHAWHAILLDEHLSGRRAVDILPQLRRQAPTAAIIVQAAEYNTLTVLQALQMGADYCVSKQSPAFMNELPLATMQVLEKRDLRQRLGVALERYSRLADSLDEVAYELDAQGCFLSVSSSVFALLGYRPHEMIGAHYSTIIDPADRHKAAHRFNERRTAVRTTRSFAIRLVAKHVPPESGAVIEAELTATGLYGQPHVYVGTAGLLRASHGSSVPGEDSGRLLRLEQAVATIAAELAQPMSEILHHADALLKQVQSRHLEGPLRTMALEAARAAESARRLGALIPPRGAALPAGMASDVRQETAPPSPQETVTPPSFKTRGTPEPSVSDRPKTPLAERRRSPRIDLFSTACLKLNEVTWRGIAMNISLGGLYMILEGSVTASQNQSLHVELLSGPGFLAIPGKVQEIRPAVGREEAASGIPHTGLAIEFGTLGSPEQPILASLVEGLRDRLVSVSVTASLVSAE